MEMKARKVGGVDRIFDVSDSRQTGVGDAHPDGGVSIGLDALLQPRGISPFLGRE
jgi:hypothetical protein